MEIESGLLSFIQQQLDEQTRSFTDGTKRNNEQQEREEGSSEIDVLPNTSLPHTIVIGTMASIIGLTVWLLTKKIVLAVLAVAVLFVILVFYKDKIRSLIEKIKIPTPGT